ncbi:UvrD-helicase domain-containing protein, partial [Methylobacterium sp. WL18]|uniref:UvrD-helicase domain-containing protein n=1 Tax=Methylobacterium sp. WL18 TaxID=2603897 RepID=UPI0016504B28
MSSVPAPRPFVVDDLTQANQRRAADPRASAWVSANAGAGKTKVLTDRVVRLLLDGAPPGRILCLTFTKAAAANMAIRVFRLLGRWVTLDDAALAAELTALTGERADAERLRMARRLFARAVETPGGLKIETLHALCERLLHMFPFEANVPARFVVLDETKAREIFDIEMANVLADAVSNGDTPLSAALARVTPEATGDTLRAAIRSALRARSLIGDRARMERSFEELHGALGLADEENAEAVEAAILDGGPGCRPEDRAALIDGLRTGKANDEKLADALAAAEAERARSEDLPDRSEALDLYRGVFFTQKDEPKADTSLGTKGVPADVKACLIAERNRLEPLFDRLRAARAHARTQALFQLAAEIHRRVEAQKARLGALDFDDLIHKALDLLARVGAGWVLYKLDRGIDHVLVDEAQDTNPEQWEILRAITQEFAAGEGARAGTRTRFAVGDPKQSIYGFQGAEPREFALTRAAWIQESRAAGLTFEDVPLTLSFRSTGMVLQAVDAVFALDAHNEGLSFEDVARRTVHASARPGAPGAVELWPIAEPEPAPEPDAWTAPVDAPETSAPAIVTARRVAQAVRTWTIQGDATGRVWRPGDVLILVRKRGPAFEEVIRALKGLGVPVAGQDRLEVSAPGAPDATASLGFTVGWGGSETAEAPDLLDLTLDKAAYAAGDTLRAKLSPSFKGQASLMVVGDRVHETVEVSVPSGGTTVSLPVKAEWGAGAYLVATAYRPLDQAAKRLPGRALGLAWFSVDRERRSLGVAVKAPERTRPRQDLTIPVQLTGLKAGEPARITVALVDVGILNLTRYEAPNPTQYFLGQKALGPEFRDLYGYLIDGMQGSAGAIRSGGDAGG